MISTDFVFASSGDGGCGGVAVGDLESVIVQDFLPMELISRTTTPFFVSIQDN